MHYFKAQDIKTVFPKIYNMDRKDNKEFIEIKADHYIQLIDQKLKDVYFDRFLEQFSLKSM